MARNVQIVKMPELWKVPATLEHARLMSTDLLPDIEEEVHASGGYKPLEACEAALKASTYSWAGYLHGELALIYGVAECVHPIRGDFAVPWALTGNVVKKYPKAYWKGSKEVIAEFRKRWPYLINMVDARRSYALKWIERLGFKVSAPEPWGKFQKPFCKIELRSLVCASQ